MESSHNITPIEVVMDDVQRRPLSHLDPDHLSTTPNPEDVECHHPLLDGTGDSGRHPPPPPPSPSSPHALQQKPQPHQPMTSPQPSPPTSRPLRVSKKPLNWQTSYNPVYDIPESSIVVPDGSGDSGRRLPRLPRRQTQHPPSWLYNIKYLVFSGGGIKGYAYAGSIVALDKAFFQHKKNLYQQLEGMSGSSIGAMFALYVAMGVRGQQLIKDVMQTNLMELSQHMTIENLMTVYGLCSPKFFQQTVYNALERFMGKGDITFQELYDITRKHYVCCVTNITTNQAEYHSHKSTPHFRVFESVAASMCIPLLVAPCIIQGQCYVDGGMNDNCPFRVFPISDSLIFYLDGWTRPTDMASFQHYVAFLAGNIWQTLDRNNFKWLKQEEDQEHLVKIFIDQLSILDFNITTESKQALIAKGRSVIEKLAYPRHMEMDLINIFVKGLCMIVLEHFLSKRKP